MECGEVVHQYTLLQQALNFIHPPMNNVILHTRESANNINYIEKLMMTPLTSMVYDKTRVLRGYHASDMPKKRPS